MALTFSLSTIPLCRSTGAPSHSSSSDNGRRSWREGSTAVGQRRSTVRNTRELRHLTRLPVFIGHPNTSGRYGTRHTPRYQRALGGGLTIAVTTHLERAIVSVAEDLKRIHACLAMIGLKQPAARQPPAGGRRAIARDADRHNPVRIPWCGGWSWRHGRCSGPSVQHSRATAGSPIQVNYPASSAGSVQQTLGFTRRTASIMAPGSRVRKRI